MYTVVLREDLITRTILFLLVGWVEILLHFSDNGIFSYVFQKENNKDSAAETEEEMAPHYNESA